MNKKEKLKKLYLKYDLTPDDVFTSPLGFTIITRSGIDKIQGVERIEIAYKGKLGFLYIEGENQNPRLDDLVNYVYFLGIKTEIISEWLIEENKKKEGNDYDIVDIGIGCNSPTVIMSNDSMSFHAAIFSKILNHAHDRKVIEMK